MANFELSEPLKHSEKRFKRFGKPIFGMLISILCLVFIAQKVDLHRLGIAFKQFNWIYLIYALSSLAIGYFFRILRWTFMLKAAQAQVGMNTCTAPFLGSMALNNILPLRLGDVVRALVFPPAIGVDKAIAASSLVMERLVDLLTVFACLICGLVIAKHTQLPTWLARSVFSAVTVGSCTLILVFFFSERLGKLLQNYGIKNQRFKFLAKVAPLFFGFAAMSKFRVLIGLFLLSFIVWVCEAGFFWQLLIGFHLQSNFALAMVVMSIITLSTLVPSSPGYIGPFHLAAFSSISLLGGSSDQAASFALLSHLSLWLPTTLAGAIAMLIRPDLFKIVIKKNKSPDTFNLGINNESI